MFDISISARASDLGKDFENISEEVKGYVDTAIAQVAQATYAEGIRLAQERLKTTKQDYIRSFNLYELGSNIYIISLTGNHANAIEDGYSSFNMIGGFLNGPKAKISKKGIVYNIIPFYHKPYSQAPLNSKASQLRDALGSVLKMYGLDKIFKDSKGNAYQGKVATLVKTGIKNLDGLTKYQNNYGKRAQSSYVTYRRVSENTPSSKWNHPGYKGAKIFPDLEQFVSEQIDSIINKLL